MIDYMSASQQKVITRVTMLCLTKLVCSASYAGDNVRWGVWLGRHIC